MVALNYELGDHELNAELFECLMASDSAKAEDIFPHVFESLVLSKSWVTARKFVVDPFSESADLIGTLQERLASLPASSGLGGLGSMARRGLVAGCAKSLRMLMDVLVGNGEPELAEEVCKFALALVACATVRDQIEGIVRDAVA